MEEHRGESPVGLIPGGAFLFPERRCIMARVIMKKGREDLVLPRMLETLQKKGLIVAIVNYPVSGK